MKAKSGKVHPTGLYLLKFNNRDKQWVLLLELLKKTRLKVVMTSSLDVSN